MYYLTHRAKIIDEIDNASARSTLTNVLKTKRLPHAFLFVGQKGTGKTSSARILAKAINCLQNVFSQKGESVEPCNTCSNCQAIDHGSSSDVIEMDAASNRGIEEVKNLIKEAAFAPMTSRYRVFIIDEAHMITHDAFNALLKTLEEPPDAVVFVLATTNEEKVPKTIISRCMRINFGRAQHEDLKRMFDRVIKREKLTVDPAVIEIIITHSDYSFRDALKHLEELVIQNKLNVTDAHAHLGVRSKQSLLRIMQTQPLAEALRWTNQFIESGGSTRILIPEMLEELRTVLMAKSGLGVVDPAYQKFTLGEISYFMKSLTEAYNTLRQAPIESIPLEIAIVEFYNYKNRKTAS